MGLDIDKLRQKLQDTKEKQQNRGGGKVDYWKPKDGRNVIRILPAKDGQEFYSEAVVRYNVGPKNRMVTVPTDSKEPCPIREFVDALYKSGDKGDEKLAKKMKASTRYYFNVIDRSVEEDSEEYGKVLVFGCGTTIFTDILGIIVDPDFGDITNPDEGYDIIITKSGKGLDTEYKTVARPKQTAIGIADWREKLYDLAKIATPKSLEKREQILSGEDSEDDEDDDDKSTTSSKSKGKTQTESGGGSKKTNASNDEDDDFSDDEADDIEKEIQATLNKYRKN